MSWTPPDGFSFTLWNFMSVGMMSFCATDERPFQGNADWVSPHVPSALNSLVFCKMCQRKHHLRLLAFETKHPSLLAEVPGDRSGLKITAAVTAVVSCPRSWSQHALSPHKFSSPWFAFVHEIFKWIQVYQICKYIKHVQRKHLVIINHKEIYFKLIL